MTIYAMFMKHMVTKKRSVSFEDDDQMQHFSAIAARSLAQKKEDLGAFHYSMYNRVVTLC